MADELVFYTNPMSRGRMIRWMLEEGGQPYRTEVLTYGPDGMKADAYLRINPMGKVPAIKHGDTVVTETGAICAYLADAFPAANLAPPHGSKERGAYYRWLFFISGGAEPAITAKAFGFSVPPERKASVGYGTIEEVSDVLERALSGREYLIGGRFSAADLYVGSMLGWGMRFGAVEKRPVFESYFGRLAERPAAKRANEIDDALIAEAEKAKG
jgi:glutathione S-transferase